MEVALTFWDRVAQWSEILGGFAFIIVAIVLFRKYVLPAVQANEIAKNAELVHAEQRRDALRAEVVAARAKLEDADRDASSIIARAESDATRERERIIDEARNEGVRMIANARGELDRGRIAGRDALRIEFIEKALNRARALAVERVDADLNARLVAKTVDDLAAGKKA
jgi:F0F1-type ATP synthase membrane subunit b/b'